VDVQDKVRENRVRRQALRHNLVLRKGRARIWSVDDQGGYMLIDASTTVCVAGGRFDWTLDEVETFLAEPQ